MRAGRPLAAFGGAASIAEARHFSRQLVGHKMAGGDEANRLVIGIENQPGA